MQQFSKLRTSFEKGVVGINQKTRTLFAGTAISHTSKQIGYFKWTFVLTHKTKASGTQNARLDCFPVSWAARP